MPAFLLDQQISHVVAEQLRQKRPDIGIESVLVWRQGNLRGKPDEQVLAAAHEAELTLVTYDQKTIPPLLMELASNGEHHSDVVIVDRCTPNTGSPSPSGRYELDASSKNGVSGSALSCNFEFMIPARPLKQTQPADLPS